MSGSFSAPPGGAPPLSVLGWDGQASLQSIGKEITRQELAANIRAILTEVLDPEDPVRHAEILAGGLALWKKVTAIELGPFFLKNRSYVDDLAVTTFQFLTRQWAKRKRSQQWQERHPLWDPTPAQFLDSINIPSPPSADEIDDAWELHIGSSESAMRMMYEGSARTRKGKDLGIKSRIEV